MPILGDRRYGGDAAAAPRVMLHAARLQLRHPLTGVLLSVASPLPADFRAVLRGLAARAPYFSNGSAKDIRELVDYYDRRFDMRLTSQDKQDLINFLGVL